MAKPMPVRSGRNNMRNKPHQKAKKGTLSRLLKMLFKNNKGSLLVVFFCLTISAITGVASSIFLKNLLKLIEVGKVSGLNAVLKGLTTLFIIMGTVYLTSIICNFIQSRTMAKVTQNYLHQIRTTLFDKVQSFSFVSSAFGITYMK